MTTYKPAKKDFSSMPSTKELLNEITNAPTLDNFFDKRHVFKYKLHDYLAILLEERNLKQPQVIREANINPTYGYEIFTGRKTSPARDIVLQLSLAMKCGLDDANRLLRLSNNSELYSKCKRDVILIYCISHEFSIVDTNLELHRFGEELLGCCK